MKIDPQALYTALPGRPHDFIDRHLERLDDDYFNRFSTDTMAQHIDRLLELSAEQPFVLTHRTVADNRLECTVFAYDNPGLFALLTGLFASMEYEITEGEIFTYARQSSPTLRESRKRAGRQRPLPDRRRVIDVFAGRVTSKTQRDVWLAELRQRLAFVFEQLEKNTDKARFTARSRVNEWVVDTLSRKPETREPALYPVDLNVTPDVGGQTRLRVVSQDTPAFLYTLSNALALQGLSIERVQINTRNQQVEDLIDIVDLSGRPLTDPRRIEQLKLSILLTKQFSYALDKAPDPYRALARFEQVVQDTLRKPDTRQWVERLSDPLAMRELAQVLGASDFLWEDFIRAQYEQLTPLLKPHDVPGQPFSMPSDRLHAALQEEIDKTDRLEDRKRVINTFKNRENFYIDLDHILHPDLDFRWLSERLTALADCVVNHSVRVLYEEFCDKHGAPRTVGGLSTPFAILGLGKMGGAALGYASDIELMLVYSDNGQTDGQDPLDNGVFFSRIAQSLALFIETKREGIFKIDLRLRPHGRSGPHAVSLEQFCTYYGPGGSAHSYERLALVRLRAFGGDPELGRQLERLRDDFLYNSNCIRPDELRDLRKKQFEEKNRPGVYNAKFSPGALVDVEYSVQLLQVMSGGKQPSLRTPRIHCALDALAAGGILTNEEREQLIAAYDFLRQLINGLRMLRGSARDLFLPPVDSLEFLHLARRMGYTGEQDISPARQLHVDFETHTAVVRTFVDKHLGRESLPAADTGNVADLILSDAAPESLIQRVLSDYGFAEPERAYANLLRLSGKHEQRRLFARLAILACDQLRNEPDPDMALNNWERFTATLSDPIAHYHMLFAQPRRFGILMNLFARSQYLADTLIRDPDFFEWVTTPETLHNERRTDTLALELTALAPEAETERWMLEMRRFRRREILRIGARDMCLNLPLQRITDDLSALADAVIQTALQKLSTPSTTDGFCVLAFGKLGGYELNYSSDIDLLGIFEDADGQRHDERRQRCENLMDKLRDALSRHTPEGHAYRVDLRLRPYGRSGPLVPSLDQFMDYYAHSAALWEIQALLKLRPVAGSMALGQRVIERLQSIIRQPRKPAEVFEQIQRLRQTSIDRLERKGRIEIDVKSGIGGIRDLEFAVQGLQLCYASYRPDILTGHTLSAIQKLRDAALLTEEESLNMTADYLFLRRLEHFLQIYEDRQIHRLPQQPGALKALAKRMRDVRADADDLMGELDRRRQRVHQTCTDIVERLI